MELIELMKKDNFLVLGNCENEEKTAHQILNKLKELNKNVAYIYKDGNIDDVNFDIDVLDICINYHLAIEHIKKTNKKIGAAIIQPGAENEELFKLLNEKNIPYIEGCVLVGAALLKGLNQLNKNDLFLKRYAVLESSLREYYKNNNLSFSVVTKRIFELKESNNKEKRYKGMKLEVAKQLRNNLAHLIKDESGNDYFEVSDDIIKFINEEIRFITESISAYGMCQSIDNIETCKKNDKVIDVLKIMRDTKHSHIPVLENGKVIGIFNMQTILDKILKEKTFTLDDKTIVLDLMSDVKDCYAFDFDFISRDKTFHDIEKMFERQKDNKELKMLFVTNNGLKTERLIGIITAYDVLKYD